MLALGHILNFRTWLKEKFKKGLKKADKCFMMPLLQVSTSSLCTYANFPNPTEPFKFDHICLPHCFSPSMSPYNLNLPLLYSHFFYFFLLYYFITGSRHCVKSNVRAEDFLHSAENSCLIGGKKEKGHSTQSNP